MAVLAAVAMVAAAEREECFSSSIDALPDDVLVRILSALKDAREIARCAAVSNRWHRLSASVHTLCFDLQVKAPIAQNIITRALSRCFQLQELVVLFCGSDEGMPVTEENLCIHDECVYAWLTHASPTIERVTLCLRSNLCSIWSFLQSCKKLSCLYIEDAELGVSYPSASAFQHLRHCRLHNVDMTDGMLGELVSSSPVLETLDILLLDRFWMKSPKLVSDSLVYLFIRNYTMEGLEIALQTKKLRYLYLLEVTKLRMDQRSLDYVEISSPCAVEAPGLQELGNLVIEGKDWTLKALAGVLNILRTARRLVVSAELKTKTSIRVAQFLEPLLQLQYIELSGDVLECLCEGEGEEEQVDLENRLPASKLQEVYVHLSSRKCPTVLNVFLSCTSLKFLYLVVHPREKDPGLLNHVLSRIESKKHCYVGDPILCSGSSALRELKFYKNLSVPQETGSLLSLLCDESSQSLDE